MVAQGELYWSDLFEPAGSEAGFRRPVLVVQSDALNDSRIRTTVVCPLSSQVRRADLPGQVLLRAGEGNLPQDSVVIGTQVFTTNKTELDELIGVIPRRRLLEVLTALQHVLAYSPRDP